MQTATCFLQRSRNVVILDRFFRLAIHCLLLTIFFGSGLFSSAQAAETNGNPNIIYILADDKN